jgi:transcriptional regulator with XRE-family HTH domain
MLCFKKGGELMDAINERFIELRKACKKNQSDFAKVLGLSRSGIADIETGRRNVTEKHLIMLSNWEEYNVNIEWLRTGNGEMFLPNETDILETIRHEYHLTDTQFKFVSNFLRLPENEKDIIFNFLSSVFSDGTETVEDRIEKELDAYRAELELEARRAGKSSVSDTPGDDAIKEA